jgi:hypothetical protein
MRALAKAQEDLKRARAHFEQTQAELERELGDARSALNAGDVEVACLRRQLLGNPDEGRGVEGTGGVEERGRGKEGGKEGERRTGTAAAAPQSTRGNSYPGSTSGRIAIGGVDSFGALLLGSDAKGKLQELGDEVERLRRLCARTTEERDMALSQRSEDTGMKLLLEEVREERREERRKVARLEGEIHTLTTALAGAEVRVAQALEEVMALRAVETAAGKEREREIEQEKEKEKERESEREREREALTATLKAEAQRLREEVERLEGTLAAACSELENTQKVG